MIILYHRNCIDGFTSAWIFWRHFYKEKGDKNLELVSVNYGEELPKKAYQHAMIMMVDFSYKKEVIRQLVQEGRHSVTVLDHHKTAQEDLYGLMEEPWIYQDFIYCDKEGRFKEGASIYEGRALDSSVMDNPIIREKLLDIRFDMKKCGARLAWEYCYPGLRAPRIVDYVEDRDLWKWALRDSEKINAAIGSFEFNFETWEGLHKLLEDVNDDTLITSGEAILRYKKQLIARICKGVRREMIGGWLVPVVNSCVLQSEVGNVLCVGEPFAAVEYVDGNGKTQVSLRSSDKGVDVSEIAKMYGGGGHRNASGYSA